MKKVIFTAAFLIISGLTLFAQTPPPPPNNPSTGGNGPVGGGAPIGEGIALLSVLAAAYGGKKVFNIQKIIKT